MKRSIAQSVAIIQVAMDDLPDSATISDRAVAIAQLGFPAWFAGQEQHGYVLAQAPGGPTANAEKAFTTSVDRLKNRTAANGVNTVAVAIPHPAGGDERHVFNLRTKRIEPWKIYLSAAFDRPKQLATPSPRARLPPEPIKIRPLIETVADLRHASDEFNAASDRLASAKAKEAELISEQRAATTQAAAITKGLSDRLAQDILAGLEIEDSHPETAKVRQLTTKAAAITTALPLAQSATAEAQAIADHARVLRSKVALDWAAAQQCQALQEATAAVLAMAPALATLAAVDRVKSQLLGRDLVRAPAHHPGLISTERLAFKLIKELPDRIRPHALSTGAFETAISDAVSAIKSTLENEQ